MSFGDFPGSSPSNMADVVVLISTMEPASVFWDAVRSTLSVDGKFLVQNIGSRGSVAEELRRLDADILLVELSRAEFNTDFSSYFVAQPNIAIIGIDPEGMEVVLRLRDTGFEMLGQIIRTVADGNRIDNKPRLHLLGKEQLQHIAKNREIVRPTIEHEDDAPIATVQPNEPILKWIEVCLHQQLLQEESYEKAASLRGIPLGANVVRKLFGDDYAKLNVGQLEELRSRLENVIIASSAVPQLSPIRTKFFQTCSKFELKLIERQFLLLVLAPELDGRFARAFGYLNDDYTRRRPTLSLVARILFPDAPIALNARRMLESTSILGKLELIAIDPDDDLPSAEAGLKVAGEIVSYVLRSDHEPTWYHPRIRLELSRKKTNRSMESQVSPRLSQWILPVTANPPGHPLLILDGTEDDRKWLLRVLASKGRSVVQIELKLDEPPKRLYEIASAAARISKLHDAALLLTVVGASQDRIGHTAMIQVLQQLREQVPRLALFSETDLAGSATGNLWRLHREKPDTEERARIWLEQAYDQGLDLPEGHARAMASFCPLGEVSITRALQECGSGASDLAQLTAAAKRQARSGVPSSINCIDAVFNWEDIVLPDDVLEKLQHMPVHVNQAGLVLDDWGYRARMPYGNGVAALFCGPSGTGKTMAAQVIACDLGVELFKVDLSKTVSKYIGETEKNLNAVFECAETSNAVLLFDEADALFGKRTEVKDAHDRHANVEVAYLLQRMEEFHGLAILTTNFRQNLDTAFMRRLRFVINFPMPDATLREKIWSLAFPPEAPLDADVSVGFLAQRLELTGGHIQQIAIRAAFSAAAAGSRISMRHVVAATRDELSKLGILNAEKTLAGLAA